MRIDRTQKSWLVATLALLAVGVAIYVPYSLRAPNGPGGGSPTGIAFGVAGFAMMVFAGLLGARKKVPVWRVGRAQTWLRAHLWLGLLSLPVILLHAGFRAGGALSATALALLVVVVASGLLGAALQHHLPRVMTREVPMETIYEEIASVRRQLLEEADRLVAEAEGQPESKERLRLLYDGEIRPYLAGERLQPKPVSKETDPLLEDLANICEEARQLARQARLHHWLHGWLLVHVPLSLALLVLGAVHAVMALRY